MYVKSLLNLPNLMSPDLCLGTVQFGMSYGITNKNGRVNKVEINNILKLAYLNNVKFIDTAQSYGNAESLLGLHCPSQYTPRYISKLSPLTSVNEWESTFHKTLDNLNVNCLDSFLLHNTDFLFSPESGRITKWLFSLIERKLVKRVGVSIYEPKELYKIPADLFKLVQVPVSIFDQRFLSDQIRDYALKNSISIHARSIFLQGILLSPPDKLPSFFTPDFAAHHNNLRILAQNSGISLLQLNLAFIRSLHFLEAALVGVSSSHEFQQIIDAWHLPLESFSIANHHLWAWNDYNDIDPRRWPS